VAVLPPLDLADDAVKASGGGSNLPIEPGHLIGHNNDGMGMVGVLGRLHAHQGVLEVPPRAHDWRDASLNLDRDSRKNQIRRDPDRGPSG
jgi:hypothetical protein